MLQRVNPVKGLYSRDQVFISLCLIHQIHTGLIQGDRITACQNADVMDVRLSRIAVTVTVYLEPVHHIDVNDMVLSDMVTHSGHHLRKGFQPRILIIVPKAAAR